MSKERNAELDTLSANERKIVAGGLEALRSLARTFDVWMVVGEGIKVLRAKADRLGGTKAFLGAYSYRTVMTASTTA